jgi:asparaginyl-tRNA synthetase
MRRTRVWDALQADGPQENVLVKGWVRTRRDAKGFSFLEINDGSCLQNLQAVVDHHLPGAALLGDMQTGAAVALRGQLAESPGKGQRFELQVGEMELLGRADPESYPLQKKRHSDEFLRSIPQIRARTNKYGALYRIRSELSWAIHSFFHQRAFAYVHTPIITGLDCEGAGELFRVTSLDLDRLPAPEEREIRDFFGQKAFLTVSGQLTAEVLACALGNVYTFGPTFRAENSNTPRHAAEFWMLEPEMAFADLEENMDLAEDLIVFCISHIRRECAQDLDLFARFVDTSLYETLDLVTSGPFIRLPYAQAVDILQAAHRKKKFEYEPLYGQDLQTEHERYLVETAYRRPVIVHDYPQSIKPFYMRINEDRETVAAMDVLLPRVGEIVGGSQREERYDQLVARMEEMGLNTEEYSWYLDLRRYGTVPHSGFGLGFERLLMFITGVHNIRDVLPFPRTPQHLQF